MFKIQKTKKPKLNKTEQKFTTKTKKSLKNKSLNIKNCGATKNLSANIEN